MLKRASTNIRQCSLPSIVPMGCVEAKSEKLLKFLGEWRCFVFENWFLPWNPFGAPSMEPNKVPTMELEEENFEDES